MPIPEAITDRLLSLVDSLAKVPVPKRADEALVLVRMMHRIMTSATAGQWGEVRQIQERLERATRPHGRLRLAFQVEHGGQQHSVMIAVRQYRDGLHYYWVVTRQDGVQANVEDPALTLSDEEIIERASRELTAA
jgi:hypothetical protein